MTSWRRLHDWNAAGVWEQLHQVMLTRLREHDQVDWSLAHLEKSYFRYSQKLAEKYFLEGIASGSNHCEYLLGFFLYEGKKLVQDKYRGKALLKSAADAGHQTAAHYLDYFVGGRLAKMTQAFVTELRKSLSKYPGVKNQGRNELCKCESGKSTKSAAAFEFGNIKNLSISYFN